MSACGGWGIVKIALNTDARKKKNSSKEVGDLNDRLNQMRMNL